MTKDRGCPDNKATIDYKAKWPHRGIDNIKALDWSTNDNVHDQSNKKKTVYESVLVVSVESSLNMNLYDKIKLKLNSTIWMCVCVCIRALITYLKIKEKYIKFTFKLR